MMTKIRRERNRVRKFNIIIMKKIETNIPTSHTATHTHPHTPTYKRIHTFLF